MGRKSYPFKFLDAYGKEDQRIFFGRDQEVDELYRLVFQTNLLLIYGPSGTGKTSLIRCGLANRFKPAQWLDLFVRRGSDINQSLLDAIVQRTPEKVVSAGSAAEGLDWFESMLEAEKGDEAPAGAPEAFESDDPIAQALHRLYLSTFTPIYLIFDQFEELYTLGNAEEQAQFARTIEILVQLPLPVKIIFAMREEYLARLYKLEKAVPQLRNKKLRLEPMDLPRVEQVILQATLHNPESNITLQQGEEAAIAKAIVEKIREGDVDIQLPYLQVFMDRLYETASGEPILRDKEVHFELDLVQQMGSIGGELAGFIDRQSQRIHKVLSHKFPGLQISTLWQVLSPFATLDGTKIPIQQEALLDIQQNLDLPRSHSKAEFLKEAIAELENSRILRYRKNEGTYEVAHDTLALQIADKRSEDEKAYLKTRRIITEGFAVYQDTNALLSREQLAFIKPYEARLREEIRPEQQTFIQHSKNRRLRQRLLLWSVIALAFIASILVIVRINAERDKAQTALDYLEKSNTEVVKLILKNAERDVYTLRYEDALEKIKAAASLGALKPEVAKAWLEIAFWHGEAGNTQRAAVLLDSAAALLNKPVTILQPFRESIRAFDPDEYEKLMERYYPVMVDVEGGVFDMGCDPGDNCEDLHKQEVSSFQMAKYETTWWQYFLFCRATGHEYQSPGWGTDGDNPAVSVNWYDAVDYANWVSKQKGYSAAISQDDSGRYKIDRESKGYRLPTEAEWEYAAKGGKHRSPFIYSGDSVLVEVGWFYENSGSRTRSVEDKKANALGLYHMSGNLWEWCWDWYDSDYPENPDKDYEGPEDGSFRVLRGGSWYGYAGSCRVAFRYIYSPDFRINFIGFRLVFVP
ncbi:MAG: SUMF1/EgtB/PvdO family nonheme iron enzyme [Saprospirales bacterium]|nr:SUMF1/EgtB/PvdO family nonheme iron enzyme [Saprospirales bacterium]